MHDIVNNQSLTTICLCFVCGRVTSHILEEPEKGNIIRIFTCRECGRQTLAIKTKKGIKIEER